MYTVKPKTKITKTAIMKAIDWNEKQRKLFQRLKDYYNGEHDIKKRAKAEGLKNNKIILNYPRYITRINTNYFLGNPVEYKLLGTLEDDTTMASSLEAVQEEYRKQTIKDLDKKISKDGSKYGYSFEYIYADKDNNVVSKKIEPFNCILVRDDTMDHNKLFAIVYEGVEIKQGEKVYKGVFTVDDFELINWSETLTKTTSRDHGFREVPVIEYENNDERVGDYYDVMTLVDALDLLMSDRVNDKEQLVESLMILYGFKLTPEQIKLAREERILSAPKQSEGAKVEYVTKMLNETELEILKKSIVDEIHKISMTPNMTDENFAGNSTGVALKLKLLPFELNVQDKETAFEAGLKERFRIYNSYLNTLDKKVQLIPIHKVDAEFKRGLPQNDYETSQMIANLKGLVSDETLMSQLSFIQDASEETKRVVKQLMEIANAEVPNFGTDEPNTEESDNNSENV